MDTTFKSDSSEESYAQFKRPRFSQNKESSPQMLETINGIEFAELLSENDQHPQRQYTDINKKMKKDYLMKKAMYV